LLIEAKLKNSSALIVAVRSFLGRDGSSLSIDETARLRPAHRQTKGTDQMFADFLAILQQVKADKKGVTALEYGVIAAIIVVALTLAVPPLAAALTATFALIAAAM
jgi:Flp pilus assembly pilin Flp